MKIFIRASSVFLFLFFFSCNNWNNQNEEKRPIATKEDMIKVNKFMISQDKDMIEAYIKRRKWDMQKTESGLFYEIVEKGSGKQIKFGDKVKIKYSIELIDGTEVYNSGNDGLKQVTVGESNNVTGLHEGLKLLNVGAKARFIIPPHLAYGIMGDNKRIPGRSIIIYELELLSLVQ